MAGKFEIYQDKAGEYRFRLKAGNGQNILASEGYKSKASCKAGITSVVTNAANAARFEKLQTKAGKFAFNLKSGNHQVVGSSQSYETEAARDNGIASFQNSANGASVVDVPQG